MEEENEDDQGNNNGLLKEFFLQCGEGPLDQRGPVIGGLNGDAFWKPFLEFFQLRFNVRYDLEGVFPVTHDDDPAHRFTPAVPFSDAAPKFGTEVNVGHIPEKNRRAVRPHADGNQFQVIEGLDGTQPTDHKFGLSHFQKTAAHIVVAPFDGGPHFLQGQAERLQLEGIHVHLILFHKTTDGRHFTDTRNTRQFIPKVPVLNGTELLKVVVVTAVQNILIHPPTPVASGPS